MVHNHANHFTALLHQVIMDSFVVDDLILYLDTHPDDACALEAFKAAQCQEQKSEAAYKEAVGALIAQNTEVKDGKCWGWIDDPWPWEIEV